MALGALFVLSLGAAALLVRWPGSAAGSAPPWRLAEPISETGVVDLSALLNAAALGFGGRLEPDGPVAVWSLGSESHLPCTILEPRPLELTLELLPAPGTRGLAVSVSWNGTELHSGTYLEGRWHSLKLRIPPEQQLLGQNWLGLRQGSPGAVQPSQRQAAYRRIELRPLEGPSGPLTLQRSVVALASRGWLAPRAAPEVRQMLLQTDAGPVQPGSVLEADALQALVLSEAGQPRPDLRLGRAGHVPVSDRPALPPLASAQDAVIILLDACRADAMGAYGNPSGGTPHLDRMARQGRIHSRAFAVAAYTLASVGTLLSGIPSMRTGLLDRTKRLQPQLETFPEALSAAGLSTAAFSASPYVTRNFGLDQGFSTFLELHDVPSYIHGGRYAGVVVDAFEGWLARQAPSQRSFAYVHLREPHQPYDPPFPWDRLDLTQDGQSPALGDNRWIMGINAGEIPARAEDIARIRAFYQGGLGAVDTEVGRLVGILMEAGRLERTLLVVMSDHGEAFFEHQKMTHNSTVNDEMVHIPLLLQAPGQPEGLVEPAILGTADIAPTVGEALGVEFRPMKGTETAEPPVVTSHTSAKFSSLRTGRYTFMDNKLGEGGRLYDALADPREDQDLSRRRPVLASALSLRLQELLAGHRRALKQLGQVEAVPLDASTEEELKALGYVE